MPRCRVWGPSKSGPTQSMSCTTSCCKGGWGCSGFINNFGGGRRVTACSCTAVNTCSQLRQTLGAYGPAGTIVAQVALLIWWQRRHVATDKHNPLPIDMTQPSEHIFFPKNKLNVVYIWPLVCHSQAVGSTGAAGVDAGLQGRAGAAAACHAHRRVAGARGPQDAGARDSILSQIVHRNG